MSLKTRAFALGLAAASLSVPLARAADHQDGTNVIADPSTDIGDLYSWMDSTASVLNMAMTVYPSANKTTSKFSSTALYVFHILSKASFSDTASYAEFPVICSFSSAATQTIQCWAGANEYVTGNPNTGVGLVSQSGKLRVFAGPRNDPFFFNLNSFNAVASAVKTLLPTVTRDTAGCAALNATQQATVKTALSTPANDAFLGKNVLAIVISLDKTLVTTPQRQTITVYGTTNKPVP